MKIILEYFVLFKQIRHSTSVISIDKIAMEILGQVLIVLLPNMRDKQETLALKVPVNSRLGGPKKSFWA